MSLVAIPLRSFLHILANTEGESKSGLSEVSLNGPQCSLGFESHQHMESMPPSIPCAVSHAGLSLEG